MTDLTAARNAVISTYYNTDTPVGDGTFDGMVDALLAAHRQQMVEALRAKMTQYDADFSHDVFGMGVVCGLGNAAAYLETL